jgi:hypothetical protein
MGKKIVCQLLLLLRRTIFLWGHILKVQHVMLIRWENFGAFLSWCLTQENILTRDVLNEFYCMYYCLFSMHIIRHATNISWPWPAHAKLSPVPVLNRLWNNACPGTLSRFLSWFPLGYHEIITRIRDYVASSMQALPWLTASIVSIK